MRKLTARGLVAANEFISPAEDALASEVLVGTTVVSYQATGGAYPKATTVKKKKLKKKPSPLMAKLLKRI